MERVRGIADRLDWDDLRAFLLVAENRGFRSAATVQPLSANTLRRRVGRLEDALSGPIVRRTRDGCVPTDAGLLLLQAVREMREAALGASSARGANVLVKSGELRIGCTEGLGSLWLTPRLEALGAQLGGLTVSLQLDYDPAVDRSDIVDVGLSFGPPERPDLVRARLATLHFMLFASEAYLRRCGAPATLDDIRHHRLIEQSGPGLSPGLADFLIGTDRPSGMVPIRSNSALSVYWAVVAGAGIAALPTYARAISTRVIPIDVPLPLRFELWYYFHANARYSPAVRAAVDWLKQAFDPAANPWFAERFVHPRDFPRHRRGKVVNLFEDMHGREGVT
jgi:DNA-binding transcriptional LysR family regulator